MTRSSKWSIALNMLMKITGSDRTTPFSSSGWKHGCTMLFMSKYKLSTAMISVTVTLFSSDPVFSYLGRNPRSAVVGSSVDTAPSATGKAWGPCVRG